LGLSSRQVFAYLVSEHVYVLLAGLAAGVAPAVVAVQPAMRSLGPGMPVGAMALILATMFASGLLGTIGAVLTASRMRLVEAMRGE
jgi:ABC-type antimicrobial peptide transport system permease subunit